MKDMHIMCRPSNFPLLKPKKNNNNNILIWIINSHIFFRLIIHIEFWSTNNVVIWAPIKLSLIFGVDFQFYKGLYLLAQISKVISQFHVPHYMEFYERKKKRWLYDYGSFFFFFEEKRLWIFFFFFWRNSNTY